MSNYPPGVTGSEPEIVGEPDVECPICGHDHMDDGSDLVEAIAEYNNDLARVDHYYAIEGGGEIEEGHVFCTPAEGEEIKAYLEQHLIHEHSTHTTAETVVVEGGGEYDFTTEDGTEALDIAKDIVMTSGFHFDESDDEPTGLEGAGSKYNDK